MHAHAHALYLGTQCDRASHTPLKSALLPASIQQVLLTSYEELNAWWRKKMCGTRKEQNGEWWNLLIAQMNTIISCMQLRFPTTELWHLWEAGAPLQNIAHHCQWGSWLCTSNEAGLPASSSPLATHLRATWQEEVDGHFWAQLLWEQVVVLFPPCLLCVVTFVRILFSLVWSSLYCWIAKNLKMVFSI